MLLLINSWCNVQKNLIYIYMIFIMKVKKNLSIVNLLSVCNFCIEIIIFFFLKVFFNSLKFYN